MLTNLPLQAFFGPSKLRDITPLRVEEYHQARAKDVCICSSIFCVTANAEWTS